MGIMVSEIYDAFIAAGVPEAKARSAAEAIPATEQLATKTDLAVLRTEMATEFKYLYRHLWIVAAGIVGLNVALIKLLP